MEDMLSEVDRGKITQWLGIKPLTDMVGLQRRGTFYEEVRKKLNFQQWKSILRRKMQVTNEELDAYATRAAIFSDLMESSPFVGAPPFQ